MAQTINPVVYRARGVTWEVGAALYATSSVAVSTAVAVAVSWLGRVVPGAWMGSRVGLIMGFFTLLYAMHELRIIRMPAMQFRRQVPAYWRNLYHPYMVAMLYGAQLGLGFSVHITSSAYYLFLVGLFLFTSPSYALAGGVLYGIARAGFVLLQGFSESYDRFEASWLGLQWQYACVGAYLMAGSAGLLLITS